MSHGISGRFKALAQPLTEDVQDDAADDEPLEAVPAARIAPGQAQGGIIHSMRMAHATLHATLQTMHQRLTSLGLPFMLQQRYAVLSSGRNVRVLKRAIST